MNEPKLTMAQQIAEAARAFQFQRTGHAPKAVTVVLSEGTLVVTLHGALTPAEEALAMSPEGAAQVREFHRQLFASSSDSLRQEIKRVTGVEVRERSRLFRQARRSCNRRSSHRPEDSDGHRGLPLRRPATSDPATTVVPLVWIRPGRKIPACVVEPLANVKQAEPQVLPRDRMTTCR